MDFKNGNELLELCRPVMERLSSEPAEGWLPEAVAFWEKHR